MVVRIFRWAAALALIAGSSAQAAVTVFTDEATFRAATGASLASLPTPTGPPTVGDLWKLGPAMDVDVTSNRSAVFDQAHPYCVGECLDGLAATIADPMLAITDEENFIVRSRNSTSSFTLIPIYAFGFSVYEPISVTRGNNSASELCGGGVSEACTQSRFKITLRDFNAPVATFFFEPGDDDWGFWGVQSSVAFDNVVVSEEVGTRDNEYFSRFFSATSFMTPPPGSVPEPSTAALAALACALALRTRSSRRVRRPA